MISSILNIVIKNFKITFKNKTNYLIFLLLPLIIITVFGGLYFNTQGYNLKVGLVSNDKTPLYEEYKQSLVDSKFGIVELNDSQTCSLYIKDSIVNVCLLFPENFELKDDSQLQLNIVIDSTKKKLLPIIKNNLIRIIDIQNDKIKKEVTTQLVAEIIKGKQVTKLSEEELIKVNNNLKKVGEELKIMKMDFLKNSIWF